MSDLPTNDAPKKTSATIDRRRFLRGLLATGTLAAIAPQTAAKTWAEGEAKAAKIADTAPSVEAIADPYPPNSFGQIISLNEVVWRNDLVVLTDPPDAVTSGGKEAPILLTYDTEKRLRSYGSPELLRAIGQPAKDPTDANTATTPPRSDLMEGIRPEQVQIDNRAGILKIDGIPRIQWPVPKDRSSIDPANPKSKWLVDTLGAHVHIAPLSETLEPELQRTIPVSMPAIRAHWMHSRHIYTDAKQITPLLPKPIVGRYHTLTPPPGQEHQLIPANRVDVTRLNYRQWAYENGAKTAYNILHWQPDRDADAKEKFVPERNNLFALNLALLESSWLDTPGCNPFITNFAGYMGLFQFGMQALGAHKAMVTNGQWQSTKINDVPITNNTAFLHNWQAQMTAFSYHSYGLYEQLQATWTKTHHKPHMHGISITGLIAAAHLRSPKDAKKYALDNITRNDGTGTSNSFYAQKYGVLAADTFYHGYGLNVTKEAQDLLDEMFAREQREHGSNARSFTMPNEITRGTEAEPDNLRRASSPTIDWKKFIKHRADEQKNVNINPPRK